MNGAPDKRSIRDIDLAGRRVFLRVDYNVQVEDGAVVDDLRLRESLPTIEHLREAGASVVLCSHRGRPRGQVVENLRNVPVATHLSRLIGAPVRAVGDCVGPEAEAAAEALAPGELLMLENVRFHPGEEENDPEFAARLARLADVYVSDAFGTAHRPHASIVGTPKLLPSVAGLLLERELDALGGLTAPERPFAIVLGGAKVADKIDILDHLAVKADVICVGGAVANTFLAAQDVDVADSLWQRGGLDGARDVLAQAAARRDLRLYLPVDAVAGFGAADAGHVRKVPVDSIPPRLAHPRHRPRDRRAVPHGPPPHADGRLERPAGPVRARAVRPRLPGDGRDARRLGGPRGGGRRRDGGSRPARGRRRPHRPHLDGRRRLPGHAPGPPPPRRRRPRRRVGATRTRHAVSARAAPPAPYQCP